MESGDGPDCPGRKAAMAASLQMEQSYGCVTRTGGAKRLNSYAERGVYIVCGGVRSHYMGLTDELGPVRYASSSRGTRLRRT